MIIDEVFEEQSDVKLVGAGRTFLICFVEVFYYLFCYHYGSDVWVRFMLIQRYNACYRTLVSQIGLQSYHKNKTFQHFKRLCAVCKVKIHPYNHKSALYTLLHIESFVVVDDRGLVKKRSTFD